MNSPKIVFSVFFLAVFCAGAYSQTAYSESESYKPRADLANTKRKANKNTPVGNEAITIPISVRDKTGKFVTDLTDKDVRIFVDDSEIPLTSLQKESEPLNVVLAIDVSPSFDDKLTNVLANAIQLTRQLPADTRVTVIEFSTSYKVRCQGVTDRAVIEKCISQIDLGGDGTSIYYVIATMFEKVLPKTPGPRRSVVLFTDGVDTTSQTRSYERSLTEAEKEGASIIVVPYETQHAASQPPRKLSPMEAALLGKWPGDPAGPSGTRAGNSPELYKLGQQYLSELIRITGGRSIQAKHFDVATKMLTDELQSRYYAIIDVPRKGPGSRQLKVRINRPDLEVVARGSFVEK